MGNTGIMTLNLRAVCVRERQRQRARAREREREREREITKVFEKGAERKKNRHGCALDQLHRSAGEDREEQTTETEDSETDRER